MYVCPYPLILYKIYIFLRYLPVKASRSVLTWLIHVALVDLELAVHPMEPWVTRAPVPIDPVHARPV